MINRVFIETTWKAVVLILTTALLFASTMFASVDIFVESALMSKWYAFVVGALICGIIMILDRKTKLIFDRLSLVLSVFIGFLVLRGVLSDTTTIQVLLLMSFLVVHLFFKSCKLPVNHISTIIVAVCLMQANYGLLQYLGVFHVSNAHKILGSFDNPAGFAACLAAGYPFCLSLCRKTKYIGIISAAVIACAVALAESRAGVVAIILTTGIYIFTQLKSRKFRRIYIISLSAIFLLVSVALFCYKKNSAIGRMLIWQNSIEMVVDKPIFGHGAGSFSVEYMQYQANYFTKNPNSNFAQLADNVSHPFNEYLLLTIEYGVVGLLILLGVIVIAFRSKNATIPLLPIISVAVFACFSYPLRYSFVVLVLAYSFSCISNGRQCRAKLNMVARSILLVVVCLGAAFLVKDIRFEYCCGQLVGQTYLGKYSGVKSNYAALYEKWNGDIFFLYNYGAFLNYAGDYQLSNSVMAKCVEHFNDYDVQMLIAENHVELGEKSEAERHYILASRMIPNRFYPLSKLLKLYDNSGEVDKATAIANIIINKEIKVPSPSVHKIIKDAQDFIDNHNLD